jgi:hypothetical protein
MFSTIAKPAASSLAEFILLPLAARIIAGLI